MPPSNAIQQTMTKKKHIDEIQPATVDEHFQLILNDRSTIESEFVKVTPDDLPEWFDEKLFKRGQKFYMDNLLAFSAVQLAGLIAILSNPDALEVLQYTKRSDTISLSFKRYAETLVLIHGLFKSDILDPNSKWFKALNSIRLRHANTSRKRVREGLNGIYQKDMAITQFGFLGYIYVCPEYVGLAHSTHDEKVAFAHFWRVTGHLLGIDDRINICRRSVSETTELCKKIASEILAKYMDEPETDFLEMVANVVNGFWYIDVSLNETAFLNFTYKVTGLKFKRPYGWYSYFNMKLHEWILYLCSVPYIGKVVRVIFNYILLATYWTVEHCPIVAWIAFGKEKSQLCPYLGT